MRITAIETIQLGEFPNLCFVRLHTDAGLVGLGETRWPPRHDRSTAGLTRQRCPTSVGAAEPIFQEGLKM